MAFLPAGFNCLPRDIPISSIHILMHYFISLTAIYLRFPVSTDVIFPANISSNTFSHETRDILISFDVSCTLKNLWLYPKHEFMYDSKYDNACSRFQNISSLRLTKEDNYLKFRPYIVFNL